jgi:hypothetical protein
MGLRSILQRWFGDDRTARALSLEAARRCETAVWQRVGDRATTMPLAEARGYVRARGAAIVRRQVELVLLSHPETSAVSRVQVLELALEAAVVRAVDVLRTRSVMPAPRRQAA